MGYFTWSNSATRGALIKDGLFSEIATKANTVTSSHCPSNYSTNWGHNGSYNSSTHSYGSCSNYSDWGDNGNNSNNSSDWGKVKSGGYNCTIKYASLKENYFEYIFFSK